MEKDKKFGVLFQFIKFGMVVAVNTILSYIIYNCCYYFFDTGVHIANIIAFIITVFIAYLLQSRFVFKQEENSEQRVWWKVLIKTYISYSFTGLFLTELLLILWIDIIDLGQYLGDMCDWVNSSFEAKFTPGDLAASMAPILNMVVTIPLNFLINKFWAYHSKKKTG